MIRQRPDTPQSSHLSTPPPESSPRSSIVVSDWDADDEETMSMEDVRPSPPPPNVVVAQNSTEQETQSYPQRPTLPDVLSNSAPPPWTLSAFTAYLSQNHCLENLEFTMDAERYRERYDALSSQISITPNVEEFKYIKMLWQRLIDAYIIPDGPREINLPSNVRDSLLSVPNHTAPPRPETLNAAVKIIYNLMEESVLIQFLNEVPSSKSRQSNHNRHKGNDVKPRKRGGSDSSAEKRSARSKSSRRASPSSSLDIPPSRSEYSKGDPTGRLTPAPGYTKGNSRAPSHTSGGNPDPGTQTDDSAASDPDREPMTPPNTPPSSDFGGHSPRTRNDNGWKKMLGWKKKSSNGMRDGRFPTLED